MRRVVVDTSVYQFMVTKSAGPKADQDGAQKFVRNGSDKGAPMWQIEVLALDKQNEGGETLMVTAAGEKPDVAVGQVVDLVGLIAIPWQNNGRGGLSFKADAIRVLTGASV